MNLNLSTKEIEQAIKKQTTFDGKLLPDMAESYNILSLVNILLERSYRLEEIEGKYE